MSDRLSPEAQRKLDAMITVHREFTAAAQARLAALVRAQTYIITGRLRVVDVCQALGVTERTWYRWAAELELRELAGDVVAQIDTALTGAGATEQTTGRDVRADADLELALLAAGGRFRAEGEHT